MQRALAGALLFLAGTDLACAQTPTDDAARLVGAPWEMSNAERDKVCGLTFSAARAPGGYRLDFEPTCTELFPSVKDIVAWRFAESDLLRFIDARGKTLIEFSEVETGVFEAPTPGLGLLFLQPPGSESAAAPDNAATVAGDWVMMRAGRPVCRVTLASASPGAAAPLTVKSGCDASVTRLALTSWQMDEGDLILTPTRGVPWRFEDDDAGGWRRIAAGEAITLVRP